jgi:transposase-like protein
MKRFLTSAILLWAGTAVAQDTVPAIELAPGRSTILRTLERENRELRQANEILRKASAYFAMAELDRRSKT